MCPCILSLPRGSVNYILHTSDIYTQIYTFDFFAVQRPEYQILSYEKTAATLTLPLTGRFLPPQSSSSLWGLPALDHASELSQLPSYGQVGKLGSYKSPVHSPASDNSSHKSALCWNHVDFPGPPLSLVCYTWFPCMSFCGPKSLNSQRLNMHHCSARLGEG